MDTQSHIEGKEIEEIAEIKLDEDGFKIIEKSNVFNKFSLYDFIIEKNGQKFYVEVKRKNINSKKLSKEDRVFDFGLSQFKFLDEHRENVKILVGWVTEDNRVGFHYSKLDDFSDKSPHRKKGKRLKITNKVAYSPIRNPGIYRKISDYIKG